MMPLPQFDVKETPRPPDDNVLPFLRRVQQPLSDAELMAVRAMLADWEVVKRGDPMIRRLLDDS